MSERENIDSRKESDIASLVDSVFLSGDTSVCSEVIEMQKLPPRLVGLEQAVENLEMFIEEFEESLEDTCELLLTARDILNGMIRDGCIDRRIAIDKLDALREFYENEYCDGDGNDQHWLKQMNRVLDYAEMHVYSVEHW